MKNKGLKSFLAILLLVYPLMGSAESVDRSSNSEPKESMHSAASPDKTPKSGYQVDGRTSASVLAAKRSHSVSKQDETGLAVFSGLMAIGLIVFVTKIFMESK